LPDFPWYKTPKREKYTKWQQNIPIGRKIYQMAKNMPTSSITRPSKMYPNWDFWQPFAFPYANSLLKQLGISS
jgi:hypothetical protein